MVMAAIFALICFGIAITGFRSIGEMTDAVQVADSTGFAWFWTFLGTVAAVLGAVSWWILRTQDEGEDA